jgi:hypothetical protein
VAGAAFSISGESDYRQAAAEPECIDVPGEHPLGELGRAAVDDDGL